MDPAQKRAGVDIVFGYQAGQGRAIALPIMIAQGFGVIAADAKGVCDPITHPHLDLFEKLCRWGIKRVIEVENPGFNVGKAVARHGETLEPLLTLCNMRLARTGPVGKVKTGGASWTKQNPGNAMPMN